MFAITLLLVLTIVSQSSADADSMIAELSAGRVDAGYTKSAGYESGQVWLQIRLGTAYCVKSIKHKWQRHYKDSYSCTPDGCTCRGQVCEEFNLKVWLQNGEDLTESSSCKWGDTFNFTMGHFDEYVQDNIHEVSFADESGTKIVALSIGQNRFPNHPANNYRDYFETWVKLDMGQSHCVRQIIHRFGTSPDTPWNDKYTCQQNGCTCVGPLCEIVSFDVTSDQESSNPDCFVGETFKFLAPGHMHMGYGDSDEADVYHQIVFQGTGAGSSDCEDDHKKCRQWAKSGFCANGDYRDYMTTTCQKSCSSCREEEEAIEEAIEEETPELISHLMVSQSSTDKVKKKKMEARFAVDGLDSTRSQTKCSNEVAWFRYKFEEASRVAGVEIVSGNFNQKRAKLNGALVFAVEVDGLKKKCGQILVRSSSSRADQTYTVHCGGTYATSIEIVQRTKYKNKKCLELKEVRVYGFPGLPTTKPTTKPPTTKPTYSSTPQSQITMYLLTEGAQAKPWLQVDDGVSFEHDVSAAALQITTSATLGSEKRMWVKFSDERHRWSGGFAVRFYSVPEYWIDFCEYYPYRTFPITPPHRDINIWTIQRTTAGLTVTCNGVVVLTVVLSDDLACGSSWRPDWSRNTTHIFFSYSDTASEYWRAERSTEE